MLPEQREQALRDIVVKSSIYIEDYNQRLGRGVTSKEKEIGLLQWMFQQGLETERLHQELDVGSGYEYKIQQLALLATLAHLKSEEFQLPDSV